MRNFLNRVFWEDCFNIFPELPDESIDLILVDPPYQVTQNKKDIKLPFAPLWEAYERIIKPNGAILIFGQGLFFAELILSNRKLYRYDLVWDKILISGFLNAKKMPLRRHEQIAVFYKSLPTYNPQFTQGNPLHSKGKNYIKKESKNQNYGHFNQTDDSRKGSTQKYPTSILKFQKPHPSQALHATEKPVSLLENLIKTYSSREDLVLDHCAGSGSTGEACINTGRNYILIEKDLDNYRVIQNRIFNLNK